MASTPRYPPTLRLVLIALALAIAVALIFRETPYKNIGNEELQVMLNNNIPIYDVRRPDEWRQTGVIENSLLLTFVDANGRIEPNFLSRFTAEINKDDAVILICHTGNRTSKLARYLADELGYTNVFNVDDGITQWIREKRPVTKHDYEHDYKHDNSHIKHILQHRQIMKHTATKQQGAAEHRPRPLVDLLVSIILPSVILMKFSGTEDLGASGALVVALAFPVSWGLFELIQYKKFNVIAALGLISILLTGGIGLLKLDPQWLAIKEAAIPGLMGLAVLISTYTRYPLIKTLLYNPNLMNVKKIKQSLTSKRSEKIFEKRLLNATYWLSATFLFSAIMNYMLAKWIVISPSGSAAFNEELGQMTLISYPAIAIPATIMMMAIMYYLWRTIHDMTGLKLEEIFVTPHSKG